MQIVVRDTIVPDGPPEIGFNIPVRHSHQPAICHSDQGVCSLCMKFYFRDTTQVGQCIQTGISDTEEAAILNASLQASLVVGRGMHERTVPS